MLEGAGRHFRLAMSSAQAPGLTGSSDAFLKETIAATRTRSF